MRRSSSLILFSLLICSPLISLAADNPIKVGVYQNKPKVFINSEGKASGFYIDILDYIASKEMWQIEYAPAPWEINLRRLAQGKIDLLVDIADSEKRKGLYDYNNEIVFSNWAIVYVQNHSEIQSILDLDKKTIAAMKGDISYEGIKLKIAGLDIHCTFVEVDEFSDVFELVDQKKADAGVISRLYGLQHENEYNIDRTTIICCPTNLYFAVPKNKNKYLIETIDRHLYQLKKNKQSIYYKSLIKWIEGISPWKFPPWLSWLLALSGGLLVLFAGGVFVLKMQVNARTAELSKANKELRTTQSDLLTSNESLKAINSIADTVHNSLDFQTVIEQSIESMMHHSQSPLVAIFTVAEESDYLELVHARGFDQETIKLITRLRIRGRLSGITVTKKKIVVSEDIESDNCLNPKLKKAVLREGLKSILYVPLFFHDKIIGVMALFFKEIPITKNHERETLLSIGKTIGLAMQNAKHFVWMNVEIKERKQAEEKLRSLSEELRNLSLALQTAREEEKMSIAREIHDELGQKLTALKMELSWLQRRLTEDQKILIDKTRSMSALIDATTQDVQRISMAMRPGILDDFGLSAAIGWQVEEFKERTGIPCELSLNPEDIVLDKDLSISVFRILQEALTNIMRHAEATKVEVSMKEENNEIILEVTDNGKGIEKVQVSDPKSIGIIGMRERIHFLSGKLDIFGVRDQGTKIRVNFPLDKEDKLND
jgi:signal transduction histidine kinase/ABC-type amino acid transport substrate-binding protein